MLVYCHKMNIIMIMSAISPSTQPASCHTSDHHCGVRTAYQLIILFKQKITCPTTTTGSDLREGERWNTIILSSVLGPQLSSMLDVGYGNWQVDKCSTNVWIGDPLFMSTPLLNIETICQHSNMLSLSLSLSTDTRYRSSCSMDILLPERKIFPIKSYLFNILNPSLSSSNKGNKHKAFFIFWKILSWLLTSRLYWDVILHSWVL